MQRTDLPPACTVPGAAADDFDTAAHWGGDRSPLEPPHDAVERRRPLFHPATGWVRRAERAASHYLTQNVFPWVPAIGLPYSRLLRRQLVLSETTIPVEGLAPAFDGLRVLLVTDVHAGPFITRRTLREVFERLGGVRPDLILLGGDMASSSVREIERSADAFRLLRAPLGTYAVLGNHDHYTRRPQDLIRVLESCGIETLHNRSIALERDGQRLTLAGVDDLLLGAPDLDSALSGAEAPVLLLAHNPDMLFDAARHNVALMLSGHTHAGQIRLPGLPVLVRQSRFRLDQGRYRFRETELVVSRGLGAVGIPWRLNCAPEAILLTLTRGSRVRTFPA